MSVRAGGPRVKRAIPSVVTTTRRPGRRACPSLRSQGVPAVTDAASKPTRMDAIGDAYWEEALRLNPTAATVYGDERYNHLLPDPSAAGREAELDAVRRATEAARALPDDELGNEDRITRAIFGVLADLAEEDEALHAYELREVDQIYGPQTVLPQVATFQRADTPGAPRGAGSSGCGRTGRTSTPTSRSSTRAARPAGRRHGSWRSGRSTSSGGSWTPRSTRP